MPDRIQQFQDDLDVVRIDVGVLKQRANDTTNNSVELAALKKEVEELKSGSKRPFFKDSRFWAGLVAVPVLIAGGWSIDKATGGRPAALGLIHQIIGTQPVIQSAIETDGEPIHVALGTTLEKLLSTEGNGVSANLGATMERLIKDKGMVAPVVDHAISERFGIVQSGILQLGLVRPDLVVASLCEAIGDPEEPSNSSVTLVPCQTGLSEATVRTGTSVFGLANSKSVDIDVGVYIAEFPRGTDGALSFSEVREPTPLPRIKDIISLSVDSRPVEYAEPRVWVQNEISGTTMKLGYFAIKKADLSAPDESFPLHTLTAELLSSAPDNVVVSVAFIVRVPPKP